jgi:glycosyltransferase involved in cell wall biosynthesis
MKLKIAIAGTRGIPNHYGGFEQFAQQISVDLVRMGHAVTVYNVHHHPYIAGEWEGVAIRHCYDPEPILGTAGQFIYDLNCLVDIRRQSFDVLLWLGYTSSSVWWPLYPADTIVITNMDGWEWKRSKYSKPVQWFLRQAEKWAAKHSDVLVADSSVINDYLIKKYNRPVQCISYAASVPGQYDVSVLNRFGICSNQFDLLIARMEPENNIEMMLDAVVAAETDIPLLVIGNTDNTYGNRIRKRYAAWPLIRFLNSIYDPLVLNALRHYARFYFHGHSVGGTNPSLLEAMAAGAVIIAHDNPFNRSVLGADALFAETTAAVSDILRRPPPEELAVQWRSANQKKIQLYHSRTDITQQYEQLFIRCCLAAQSKRTLPAY